MTFTTSLSSVPRMSDALTWGTRCDVSTTYASILSSFRTYPSFRLRSWPPVPSRRHTASWAMPVRLVFPGTAVLGLELRDGCRGVERHAGHGVDLHPWSPRARPGSTYAENVIVALSRGFDMRQCTSTVGRCPSGSTHGSRPAAVDAPRSRFLKSRRSLTASASGRRPRSGPRAPCGRRRG